MEEKVFKIAKKKLIEKYTLLLYCFGSGNKQKKTFLQYYPTVFLLLFF